MRFRWFVSNDIVDLSTRLSSSERADKKAIIDFNKPWQSVQIQDNYFYNNFANIVMQPTQTQS